MPSGSLSRCLAPRCRALLLRPGRCREHRPRAFAGSNGNRHARGYGKAHVARRVEVFHAQHACQWPGCGLQVRCPKKGCGQQGVAAELDHIVPKAEGGSDSPSNLRALCLPHHAQKTRADAARGRARGRGAKSQIETSGGTRSSAC